MSSRNFDTLFTTTRCIYGFFFYEPKYTANINTTYPKAGEYWKPPADQTSGVYQSPKLYHRSPCPALNVLANHGLINRDGKGLSVYGVASAARFDPFINMIQLIFSYVTVFIFSKAYKVPISSLLLIASATKALTSPAPFSNFTLATIGKHGGIEHDASLFHYDYYTKKDPALVNPDQVQQLIKLSKDGKTIGVDEIIKFRSLRTQHSIDTNPEFAFSSIAETATGTESSIFLNILGSGNKISIAHIKSFINDEKFPPGQLEVFVCSTYLACNFCFKWLNIQYSFVHFVYVDIFTFC